jgi:hypothetical protein
MSTDVRPRSRDRVAAMPNHLEDASADGGAHPASLTSSRKTAVSTLALSAIPDGLSRLTLS